MNVAIYPGLSWLALFQIFHAVSRVDRFYPKDGRSGYDPSMVRDEKQIATLAFYTVRDAAIRKASLFAPEVNRRAFRHAADDIHVLPYSKSCLAAVPLNKARLAPSLNVIFRRALRSPRDYALSVSPFPV